MITGKVVDGLAFLPLNQCSFDGECVKCGDTCVHYISWSRYCADPTFDFECGCFNGSCDSVSVENQNPQKNVYAAAPKIVAKNPLKADMKNQPPEKMYCSDKTPYGSCSKNKPLLCKDGKLVDDCQDCGCNLGFECNSQGSCSKSSCVNLINNGPMKDKLDILFLGEDYNGQNNNFRNDYNVVINAMMGHEPFKSQKSKINFYTTNKFQDLGCHYKCSGIDRMVCCDPAKVEKAAAQCPHDQIFILVNNNQYGGSGGVYSISYNGEILDKVLLHEFGHTFGDLVDEYVNGCDIKYYPEGLNCNNESNCSSWRHLQGVECVQGCNSEQWYRANVNSIMWDLAGDFNPVGEEILSEKLEAYKWD